MQHQAHERYLTAAARAKADRDLLSALPASASPAERSEAQRRARDSHNLEGIAFGELQRFRGRARARMSS